MPPSRPYAISATPERLTLHKDTRSGEVSFTVTNQTAQPIRTEVRLRVLDGAQEEWFTLQPTERIREIAPGKSSQFTVAVKVPPAVDAGNYRFRLDANSVNHPEEVYTEGPVVPVEVSPAVVPDEGFKFRWWMAVAAVVLLLLIGGGLWWALGGDSESEPEMTDMQEVPNVVGLDVEVAEERLTQAGFQVQRADPVADLNAPVNQVVSQAPTALDSVEAGSAVMLTIVGDTVRVPNVKGKSLIQGLELLRETGLEYGGAFGDQNRASEPLEGSSPGTGSAVLRGSSVRLLLPGRRILIPVEELGIREATIRRIDPNIRFRTDGTRTPQ